MYDLDRSPASLSSMPHAAHCTVLTLDKHHHTKLHYATPPPQVSRGSTYHTTRAHDIKYTSYGNKTFPLDTPLYTTPHLTSPHYQTPRHRTIPCNTENTTCIIYTAPRCTNTAPRPPLRKPLPHQVQFNWWVVSRPRVKGVKAKEKKKKRKTKEMFSIRKM